MASVYHCMITYPNVYILHGYILLPTPCTILLPPRTHSYMLYTPYLLLYTYVYYRLAKTELAADHPVTERLIALGAIEGVGEFEEEEEEEE